MSASTPTTEAPQCPPTALFRSMQLWPGGQSVTVAEAPYADGRAYWYREGYHNADAPIRYAAPGSDMARKITIEERAESYSRNEVLCCDSALVDDLLRAGFEGFAYEDIEGLYPDPSDWDVEKCRDYCHDRGITSTPDDPFDYDREKCIEELTSIDIECRDSESLETLRAAVIANIDDETLDGLDDWREAVRDNAEPQEVFEWWRVSSWLCGQLRAIGEPVIDNDYGHWWGRTCTGQGYIMDGTLQQIAALHV